MKFKKIINEAFWESSYGFVSKEAYDKFKEVSNLLNKELSEYDSLIDNLENNAVTDEEKEALESNTTYKTLISKYNDSYEIIDALSRMFEEDLIQIEDNPHDNNILIDSTIYSVSDLYDLLNDLKRTRSNLDKVNEKMKFKIRKNISESLSNKDKQIYIRELNKAEDREDLEDIIHEIFFYDKSLFAKLRKLPKDEPLEVSKERLVKIINDSMEESLNEKLGDREDIQYEIHRYDNLAPRYSKQSIIDELMDAGYSYKEAEYIANHTTNLNEASYGGAFDIEDDAYFSREQLNEFGYVLEDALANEMYDWNGKGEDSQPQLNGIWLDKNILTVAFMDKDGNEVEVNQKIDFRKVKTESDLSRYYLDTILDKAGKEFIDIYKDYNESLKEGLSDSASRIASNLYYGYASDDGQRINSALKELKELNISKEDIDYLDDLYSRMNHFSDESAYQILRQYYNESLKESKEVLYVIKDKQGNQLSRPTPDDDELWDRVESMEARGKRGLKVVVYTDESLNEKFTSVIPSLKDLKNNSYTFITKETYVQGDWVPLKIVLSNYYISKDAAAITIYRADNNRKINSYAGSYDSIVDKLKEFDIYEKPKKNESLNEAPEQDNFKLYIFLNTAARERRPLQSEDLEDFIEEECSTEEEFFEAIEDLDVVDLEDIRTEEELTDWLEGQDYGFGDPIIYKVIFKGANIYDDSDYFESIKASLESGEYDKKEGLKENLKVGDKFKSNYGDVVDIISIDKRKDGYTYVNYILHTTDTSGRCLDKKHHAEEYNMFLDGLKKAKYKKIEDGFKEDLNEAHMIPRHRIVSIWDRIYRNYGKEIADKAIKAIQEIEDKVELEKILKNLGIISYDIERYIKPEFWDESLNEELGEYDDEFYKGDDGNFYKELKSKSVYDSDGFTTDYTLYMKVVPNGSRADVEFVTVFGDNELYRPEDGYYDFETNSYEEAKEWFDNYDTEDWMDESLKEARYSDIYDDNRKKQGWWYFTTHGVQPGSIPKDLNVIEIKDGKNSKGTQGTFVKLDGILNTSELKKFDMREEVPIEESLTEDLTKYDPKEWSDEDVELHKSIDWKARNYEDYDTGESITKTIYLYGVPGYGDITKEVEMHKFLRANPIYSPYYRPIEDKPFDDMDETEGISYVGPMYDGNKEGIYDIHDRYETQKLYDLMFDSLDYSNCNTLSEMVNKFETSHIDEGYYDIRNMYEAVNKTMTPQEKQELKNIITATNDPKTVSDFLKSKYGEEEKTNEELDDEF